MPERIYETKHIETRLRSLHASICACGSEPTKSLDEYDRLLTDLGRIKLAERLGIHPDTLRSDRNPR